MLSNSSNVTRLFFFLIAEFQVIAATILLFAEPTVIAFTHLHKDTAIDLYLVAVLLFTLTFWVRSNHSRLPAVLLLILAISTVVASLLAGKAPAVEAVAVFMAFRIVQAAFEIRPGKFHQRKAEEIK